jgi:putative membrane protein
MKILVHLLVSALSVAAAAYLLPGVYVDGPWAALLTAILLLLVTFAISPAMAIMGLPMNAVTMGLFMVVTFGIAAKLVDAALGGLTISSFGWAVSFGAIVLALNATGDYVLLRRMRRRSTV